MPAQSLPGQTEVGLPALTSGQVRNLAPGGATVAEDQAAAADLNNNNHRCKKTFKKYLKKKR